MIYPFLSMFSVLLRVSFLKTLIFNFRYFSFSQALKFPVLVARNMRLRNLKGKVEIKGGVKTAGIRLGFGNMGHFDARDERGIWDNRGIVVFHSTAYLGLGTRISVNPNAVLTLGSAFSITAKSTILVEKEVTFGSDCLLSWDILVMDTDFHPIYDNAGKQINHPRSIVIGDHVWIGCQSLILKGTEIASGSVVGAQSKVSGSHTTPNSVYAGEPLKVLRSDIRWGH